MREKLDRPAGNCIGREVSHWELARFCYWNPTMYCLLESVGKMGTDRRKLLLEGVRANTSKHPTNPAGHTHTHARTDKPQPT